MGLAGSAQGLPGWQNLPRRIDDRVRGTRTLGTNTVGNSACLAGYRPGSVLAPAVTVETVGLAVLARETLTMKSYDHSNMTMDHRDRSMAAGEFKARCLALLDEVAATGRPLMVTKRGRPVAKLVPVSPPRPLLGSIVREKDLVSPVDATWDADQ